jgi:pyridoxal 5'-phosphate synthase pdxT subunit
VARVKRAGVLALQGDFEAHKQALARAGAEAVEVRTAEQLDSVDGLVLPGGESSTMLKLLDEEKLFEPLRRFGRNRPIFGTCAGAILMATKVLNPEQRSLELMDITVERNAYGRQLDSRIVRLPWERFEGGGDFEAVFIRAPIIRETGPNVNEITSYRETPVLVEDGRHLVATFHPELTLDARIHRLFVERL